MRKTLIILLTSSLLLAACGQKGPLYLPNDAAVDQADDKTGEDDSATETATESSG